MCHSPSDEGHLDAGTWVFLALVMLGVLELSEFCVACFFLVPLFFLALHA
jgi:hypothetical protein